MGQARPEPHEQSSTPYERPLNRRATRPSDQRDSTLHSLSRSISRAFSKAVGRPSEAIEPIDEEQSSSDSSLADISTTSQTAAAPSQPVRNISLTRKASIDFSLLKNQKDLRIPAHLIIEAYREALKNRGETSSGQSANNIVEQMSTQQKNPKASEKHLLKDVQPQQSIPLNQLDPGMMGFPQPKRLRQPKHSPHKRGISKPRPKALKHRIQLITKPLVDLSQISDDRKHRPGFISANFEVSDEESEDEKVPPKPSTAPAKPEVNALKRRPQIESSKLKQFSTASEKKDREKKQQDGFTFGKPSESREELKLDANQQAKSTNASIEKFDVKNPEQLPENIAKKPAFSFTPTPAEPSVASSKPVFSFGGALEDSSENKPISTPKFSLGASTPSLTQPPAGSGEPSEKKKFSFTFGNAGSSAAPAKPVDGKSETEKPEAPKAEAFKPEVPKFNFSAPSQNGNGISFGSAQPKPSLDSGKSTTFSLGNPENKSNESATKPLFNFGASTTAQTSEPAKLEAAKPEVSKFDFSKPATSAAPQPAEPPKPTEASKLAEVTQSKPPKFTFGGLKSANEVTSAKETPPPSTTFNFGSAPDAVSKPAFQFGASNPQLEAAKPAFNFGSFGSKETTPATSNLNGSATPRTTTPFTFGSSAANSGTASSGVVNFSSANRDAANPGAVAPDANGATATAPTFGPESTKAANTGTAFSFGAPSNTATAQFTFGSAKPNGKPETQPFTFGKSATKPPASQPFGAASKQSTPQPFTFGNNSSAFGASAPNPAPAVNPVPAATFGQPPAASGGFGGFGAAAGASAPSAFGGEFTFGQNNSAPAFGMPAQPAANQPDSRDTTPIPGRKLAQVKKRLQRK